MKRSDFLLSVSFLLIFGLMMISFQNCTEATFKDKVSEKVKFKQQQPVVLSEAKDPFR